MSAHDHSAQRPPGSFWTSRTGIVLIVFLAVAGLLLGYEHRVHVLTGYGFLVGLLLLCVGLYFFMHGGHAHRALGGEHDEHGRRDRP